MTTEEIRKMTLPEIDKKVDECKRDLFDLRMKLSSGTLTETHKIKEMRKTIARLKTVKHEMEIGGVDNE